MRVLVTGANGFVGTAVCRKLHESSHLLRMAFRSTDTRSNLMRQFPDRADAAIVGDLGGDPAWDEALKGVETVVHLAARAHVMNDPASDSLAAYRRVNVTGTEKLANIAIKRGVRRVVFVSSIKVNGEQTWDKPFTEEDPPCPQDPYGQSKYEAEQVLRDMSKNTGLEVVIVRPPLVYGPGVRANFLRLMRWVHRGLPLALPNVNNKRSMIAVENLADFLVSCVAHPLAANQTFLVSDGKDVSTLELVRCMAHAMNRKARIFPLPEFLFRLVAKLLRREQQMNRLFGSLTLSPQKAGKMLAWTPPVTFDEGISGTVRWYINSQDSHS